MKAGEFRETHARLEDLLTELHRTCQQPRVDRVINQIRDEIASSWTRAQDAVNALVRTQIAQGLAPMFLTEKQPYKQHPELAAMMSGGLLHAATFIQKSPSHLKFYGHVLASLAQEPQRILEIGVKGGGSTALWKALFRSATVVGVDIKLRPGLGTEPPDGVIYLQADQTDVKRLREIAAQYGPFDLVIDDGSHVTDHQAVTMRELLPQVRSGGIYVVEDIHASVKTASTRDVDFGEDIWADFTLTALQRLRGGQFERTTKGAQLASHLARWIDELIIARDVLAVRVKDREE